MQEPLVKKCPICGENTVGEECYSCGFVFPDEEKLSAPYDLDPSNDLFGEAEMESFTPAMEALDTGAAMQSVEMPELSELTANPVGLKTPSYRAPNIKVRTAAPQAPAVQPNNNPAISGTPRQPVQTVQNPPPQYPPVYQPADPLTRFVKAVSNFVTDHWWQFLLTLLLPTVGIGFGVYYFTRFRENRLVRNLILGIGFIIASMTLWIKGVDILGLDYYLREFLDDTRYY